MNTQIDLDTGQTGGDEKILNGVLDSTPAQPIIFREIWGKSYKQAKIYMGMKKKT